MWMCGLQSSAPAVAAGQGGSQVSSATRWRYARTLTIDTTATGANVPDDVANYPLAVSSTRPLRFQSGAARRSRRAVLRRPRQGLATRHRTVGPGVPGRPRSGCCSTSSQAAAGINRSRCDGGSPGRPTSAIRRRSSSELMDSWAPGIWVKTATPPPTATRIPASTRSARDGSGDKAGLTGRRPHRQRDTSRQSSRPGDCVLDPRLGRQDAAVQSDRGLDRVDLGARLLVSDPQLRNDHREGRYVVEAPASGVRARRGCAEDRRAKATRRAISLRTEPAAARRDRDAL